MTSLRSASVFAALVFLSWSGAARAASDVCYRGGSNLANFKLNGTASLNGSSIVITPDVSVQSGSAMYQTKFSATSDFHIKMHVRISTLSSVVPADGMAFVMHNDPAGPNALGQSGAGVGYQGITNSVTIEFDTYQNTWDPPDPHIAITRQGDPDHGSGTNSGLPVVEFSSLSPPMDPTNGTPFYLWIDYVAASHAVSVFVSNADSKPAVAGLLATLNLAAELGSSFYVGFTGSTGGYWDKQEFLELFASDTATTAETNCCAADTDCAASPSGTLCDTAKHVCGSCSLLNTGSCTVGAPACDQSSAHNVCSMACNGNYGSAASQACASAAFPACRTAGSAAGSCAACAGDNGAGTAADCAAGAPYCGANGYCGLCTGNADCTSAGVTHAGSLCNTNTGLCVATCASDASCGPGNACVSNTCVAKASNGATVPGGTCNTSLGSRLCVSGVCDTISNKCGYANGAGSCNSGNAATVCMSGVCSTAGVCVPTGGCYVDGECGAGKYCARSTFTCTAKAGPGAGIPNDGLHSGVCNGSNASAVCTTAACDAITNTCASANQAACSAANQCVSNLCGSNGQCGLANGQSGCSTGTATASCQSGACSTAGACIPAVSGSCYVDADCGAAFFCNRSTFTCTADLNAGVSIPNDGLHGSVCNSTVAGAVCTTGLCNAITATCAGAISAGCAAAADCEANICGGNGACGYPSGQGTCTGATASARCQSSACSSAGVCIPAASGSCWVDQDCASGQFCDRMNMACTGLLPPGALLPVDGLHGGTCADAGAVCTAGLCDATTSTCAAALGAACSADNQCASNVCGSNSKCGIATGDGTCTVSSQAAVCQSGACGPASGLCVPTSNGGCGIDADCPDGQYCDPGALACVAKLAAGTLLPSDRLHNGHCSTSLASAVCADLDCDSASNTCAHGTGSACTAAAECISDFCNSNGTCGRLVGDGPCTANNGGKICASGVCSASAGVCLGTASGCWVDADCAAGTYCNRDGGACLPLVATGAVIPDDSVHRGFCTPAVAAAVCASGLCNPLAGTCASPLDAACATAASCANNVCGTNGLCGYAAGAGSCAPGTASTLCQSGICGAASNVCISAGPGGCGNDSDCMAGQFCSGQTLHCVEATTSGTALPTDGVHGACPAGQNAACASGLCNMTTATCAAANGGACTAAAQCATGVCGSDGHCGLTDGQAGCTVATAALCQSGVCTPAGVCGSMGCAADTDCGSTAYCDAAMGLCRAKLQAGQGLPKDGKHDGSCTTAAATAVCITGACNATTSACALPNGGACTADFQCAAGACGANGKCGVADGQPGCAATNPSVCQSGLCSALGNRCLPVGAGRCAIDADCAAAMYCEGVSLTCVAKLADGARVPDDGVHDGVCQPGTGAAVCASGMCNARANTCAGAAGVACVAANTCVGDVCGSNGKCGVADGDGTCAASTQAGDCQSGLCNAAAGICQPQGEGRCVRDGDCAAGAYCDATTLTCVATLASGLPLPSDGARTGLCSGTLAAAVCASKQCNGATNTCASANAAVCSTVAECASNVCGGDGKCGALNGVACTTAATCRAGQCTMGHCGDGVTASVAQTPTSLGGGGGCSCSTGGGDAGPLGGALALLLLGLTLVRRKGVR